MKRPDVNLSDSIHNGGSERFGFSRSKQRTKTTSGTVKTAYTEIHKKRKYFQYLTNEQLPVSAIVFFFQEEHLSFQTVVPCYLCYFLKTLFVRQKVSKD